MLEIEHDRRKFIKSGVLLSGLFVTDLFSGRSIVLANDKNVKVSAHLWVYASKYPPDWNCTPILGQAFSEIKSAGFDGIELMDVLLREDDAVARIKALSKKHDLPVTGCSFGADMWNKNQHNEIIKVATLAIERLHALGGETFGVSVGNAKYLKTPQELDAQADVLMKLIPICEKNGIVLNLHNHTYEVENDLHDLKGTLSRIPDIKLGPDLNWLVRGGVDPVWFINTYGPQIVYMHFRNQKASGKWSESLDDGVIDFKGISQALKQKNFKGRVAVELAFDEPPTRSLPENWKRSRDYVTRVFGW